MIQNINYEYFICKKLLRIDLKVRNSFDYDIGCYYAGSNCYLLKKTNY